MNDMRTIKIKMDALEYLTALRAAIATGEAFMELDWMRARMSVLQETYDEAKQTFAKLFEND